MRGVSGARWFAAQVAVPVDAARMGLRTHAAAVAATGAATASTARDTMDEYCNLHQRGSGGGSGDYQFTIKAHGAYPPDWVAAAIGAERAYDHIGAVAWFELECAVENLQERYDWIGSRWWTAGRSGGWLLLVDDERPLERYDDALWRLEATLGAADAAADDVCAAVYEYRVAVDALTARARELRAIEQELRVGVRDFERYVASRECWEGIVPHRPAPSPPAAPAPLAGRGQAIGVAPDLMVVPVRRLRSPEGRAGPGQRTAPSRLAIPWNAGADRRPGRAARAHDATRL